MKKIKIIPSSKNANFAINVDEAKKNIPEWYKKSPQKIKGFEKFSLIPFNSNSTTSTYKKCTPFLDAITNGYIFSLSQDIEVIKKEDGSPFIMWRNPAFNLVTDHSNQQWDGLFYPENCHNFVYKWGNDFIIKTPRGYSTIFTHPHNRFDLPFYTLSGIVDTDRYSGAVQFPFFIKKDFIGIIKAGTPIAQITFIKREHWIKSILKYNEGFVTKAQNMLLSKIDRSYKNQFWEKKVYE